MTAYATLVAAVLLTGCGRYADFSLPAPSGPAQPVRFQFKARPQPVLSHGARGTFDSHDALNPAVVRHNERRRVHGAGKQETRKRNQALEHDFGDLSH